MDNAKFQNQFMQLHDTLWWTWIEAKDLILNSITPSQSKTVKFKYSLTIILIQLVLSCPIVTITISFKYISA